MMPVFWMVFGCVISLAALSAFVVEPGHRAAAWAGMGGPLLAVAGTLMVISRTSVRSPERVTAVMVHAFLFKIVFFLGYVTVAIRVLSLDPLPFVVSFTGYFIVLYAAAALWLQRRFVRSLSQAR